MLQLLETHQQEIEAKPMWFCEELQDCAQTITRLIKQRLDEDEEEEEDEALNLPSAGSRFFLNNDEVSENAFMSHPLSKDVVPEANREYGSKPVIFMVWTRRDKETEAALHVSPVSQWESMGIDIKMYVQHHYEKVQEIKAKREVEKAKAQSS